METLASNVTWRSWIQSFCDIRSEDSSKEFLCAKIIPVGLARQNKNFFLEEVMMMATDVDKKAASVLV